MYCADTNWVIRYLEEDGNFENTESVIIISRITYVELLSFPKLDETKSAELKENILNLFSIAEVDYDISDLAAKLRRETNLSLGDSIIMATALTFEAGLLTYDKKLKREYTKICSEQ